MICLAAQVIGAFFVNSINEWRVAQPRVIVLSRTAFYRVSYNPKNGKIDHYNKTPLEKLRVLEKTVTGLKVYLTEQEGSSGPRKWMGSMSNALAATGLTTATPKDEFEHSREYCPAYTNPSVQVATDVMANALAKAAELHKASGSAPAFTPPNVITTADRKALLADRVEARALPSVLSANARPPAPLCVFGRRSGSGWRKSSAKQRRPSSPRCAPLLRGASLVCAGVVPTARARRLAGRRSFGDVARPRLAGAAASAGEQGGRRGRSPRALESRPRTS